MARACPRSPQGKSEMNVPGKSRNSEICVFLHNLIRKTVALHVFCFCGTASNRHTAYRRKSRPLPALEPMFLNT